MSNDDTFFSQERPRLLGLAYRILSSYADAEDVVQEAWLRWHNQDRSKIDNPAGYLTTVVAHLAIDRTRAIARRRETYIGPWLPEPIVSVRGPEDRAELAESLTLGFLIMLDRLSPIERAVWLLADVFGEPYSLIGKTTGKTEVACRQIASRARRRLREQRPVPAEQLEAGLLTQLLTAVSEGDLAQTLALLDTDVVLLSDGGPRQRAARYPVVGAGRVARYVINLAQRFAVTGILATSVNGAAAMIVETEEYPPVVITGEQVEGRITRIFYLLNEEKMLGIAQPPLVR
ncbi:MAG TPA: RNA polymerase sigma factor SigJ [Acidimicrobiales bacterium]|nr:RNA polymerase sigma factor SigJ [Acidimicrobiales bacterium]